MAESRRLLLRRRFDANTRHRLKKQLAGLCITCTRPAKPGRTLCPVCMGKRTIYSKQRRSDRKASGVCCDCGRPRNDKSLCLDCRIKTVCQLRLKASTSSGVWLQLKEKLVLQGYKCVYSGIDIMPGINASLDHIVPSSRGGTHEVDNLQWVEMAVNKMKGILPSESFIAVCRMISARYPTVA